MSVLLHTLAPASVDSYSFFSNTGFGVRAPASPLSKLHDGSDATDQHYYAQGDGFAADTIAGYENFVLDTLTLLAGESIDFIRIVYRAARETHLLCDLYPRINNVKRGTKDTPAVGSWTTFSQDFAVDPADSNPWTEAKFNAQTFGWTGGHSGTQDYGVTDGVSSSGRLYVAEFYVEVWGHTDIGITLGPASAASAAAAKSGTSIVKTFTESSLATQASALAPAAVSVAASVGVRSKGKAYFAAVMDQANTNYDTIPYGRFIGVGGDEPRTSLVMAINAAPVQLSDPDEPHYLMSLHEPDGEELWAFGVTPSLRLCAVSLGRPILLSAPNVIPADGSFHTVSLEAIGTMRSLAIDGVVVASDDISGDDAKLARVGVIVTDTEPPSVRLMLFNGLEGKTRCDCSIMNLRISAEGQEMVWPLNEGSGVVFNGYEGHIDVDTGETVLNDIPDFPGMDWSLTPRWYDPSPAALVWGSLPIGSSLGAWSWLNQTKYRRLTPVSPAYRRLHDVEDTL